MTKANLKICNFEVSPGQTLNTKLQVAELADGSSIHIPLTLINGKKQGKILYLQACIHGDEVIGTEIIRKVIGKIKPDKLAGGLIAAPIVNIPAYLSKTRGFILEERGPIDMNRVFPGVREGSLTERIAYRAFTDLLLKSDAAIDFHAALSGSNIYPFTYVTPAEGEPALLKKREALAKAYGTELVYYHHENEKWHRSNYGYSFGAQASKQGIPCIMAEAGESGKLDLEFIKKGVRGVLNVMMYLGMIEGTPSVPKTQLRFDEHPVLRVNRGGIINVHVKVGQKLKSGDLIAEINNGREVVEQIQAPYDCIVLRLLTLAVVYPGAEVAWLINLTKTTKL